MAFQTRQNGLRIFQQAAIGRVSAQAESLGRSLPQILQVRVVQRQQCLGPDPDFAFGLHLGREIGKIDYFFRAIRKIENRFDFENRAAAFGNSEADAAEIFQ
jgi:hypothetical protein